MPTISDSDDAKNDHDLRALRLKLLQFEDIEIQNSSYAYYKHGAYMLQTIKP